MLRLIPILFFEPTAEECGTQYDYASACVFCGGGRLQVSPLILDVSKIPKRADVAATMVKELVFSRRLGEEIERRRMSGVRLQAVESRRKVRSVETEWQQPVIVSQPVRTVSPTRYGEDPFDGDPDGKHRCPLGAGHAAGLNILSEVHLEAASWDGADVVQTEALVGLRAGLFVPLPLVLVSQRFFQMLCETNAIGYEVEVAHLV